MLGEISHLDAAADDHVAIIRLCRTGHELEQRRFARAVDPHHTPALLAPNLEVEARINAALAVALMHLPQAHHVLARARRRREFEHDGLTAPGRLDALDLLQLLDPALHLG